MRPLFLALPERRVTHRSEHIGNTSGLLREERKVPWRKCYKMDGRPRFVARTLEGEKMALLCREFEISRKTGYKIFQRYKDCGPEGLTDRSRRPSRQATKLPFQIETLIVQLKREHLSWGAPKIREKLGRGITISRPRRSAPCVQCSIAAAWSNHCRKRRYKARGTALSKMLLPNDLWCADYEGRVHARRSALLFPADHQRLCQPLSLELRGLVHYPGNLAFTVFERMFKGFGAAR